MMSTTTSSSSSSVMRPEEAAVTPSPTPAPDGAPLVSSSAAQPQPTHTHPPPAVVAVAPPPPTQLAVTVDAAALLEEESAPPAPHAVAVGALFSSESVAADTGRKVDTISNIAVNTAPSSSPSSLRQRSRRSTANYHQDYSSEGVFTTEGEVEEVEETAVNSEQGTLSNHLSSLTPENHHHHGDSIVLSMMNPNYKSIMFSYFQKLGATPKELRDEDEEERVEQEVFALLKKVGGGRFVKYINFRSPQLGVVEVDERTARAKIHSHICRRLESQSHWAKDNPIILSLKDSHWTKDNPIILSLKDAHYRQIMFTAFQKLGAHPYSSRDAGEEKRVREETYNLLKSMGRKLMKYRDYRRNKDEFVELDEKAARQKISNDISRRLETKTHWSGVDLANELQEKDADEGEEETILGSDEDEDDGSDYEDDSRSSLPLQAAGNDVILSMQNANYKATMFSFFRQMGAHAANERDQDEETRVRNEAYDFFKGLGGRMLKLRNHRKPKEGLVEVDEKTARNKIGYDFTKRLSSYSHWANHGTSGPSREGASNIQSATKELSAKKMTNKGAAKKGSGHSSRPGGDKLVSIRKSATKYSPLTERISPYPQRNKARVTFKDDLQYSVQSHSELHGQVQVDDEVLDAESSLVNDVAMTTPRSSSREYTCGVCGQPKKGHKCTGNSSTATAAVQTPVRSRSESQAGRSTRSPKFITPTKYSTRGRRRQQNCGQCENCQREDDCGKCASCKDKVKFGGRGTKRKKCEEKRCLSIEPSLAQSATTDTSEITTPSARTRSGTKRKSAVAGNLTIMNVMADEDLENKGPSGEWSNDGLAESQILFKKPKFASFEEQMPSFEEISASEFNDLIDLLQTSPLPQRKVDTEMDWQGLYLADLSPVPIPVTRVVKLDTTKPIILGPNSAWSQRLIMTDEVAATPFHTLKPRPSKSNLPEMEPKTSDSLQFDSIMSPPSFNNDEYTPIFSDSEPKKSAKLIPYSPIKLLPEQSSSL